MALIAGLAIFLTFCVELLIFQLESVKTKGNLIFSLEPIKNIKFFVEKMKDEKKRYFEEGTHICRI